MKKDFKLVNGMTISMNVNDISFFQEINDEDGKAFLIHVKNTNQIFHVNEEVFTDLKENWINS
jgi:hypothetical protein